MPSLMPDVLQDPSSARRDGVIVTPYSMRVSPSPVRRLIGDLRDHDNVIAARLG